MLENVERKGTGTQKVAKHVRVGVIVFDDKNNASLGGWAAVAGGKPFRVSAPVGLDNTVMWISNLEYKAFVECGLSSARNHRLPYYFNRTVDQVAADHGTSVRLDPSIAPGVAQNVSSRYDRVLKLYEDAYPHKAESPTTGKTLTEDIRAACGILDSTNRAPDFLETAFAASYQTDSARATAWQADSFMVIMRYNRLRHYSKILAKPIPTEQNWRLLDPRSLPASNTQRLDLILNADFPVVAEVNINTENCPSDLAELIAVGNQAGMRTRATVLRTHASHPELLWLSHLCDVEVKGIAVAAEYTELRPNMRLPKLLSDEPAFEACYSAQLFAELHFLALAEHTKKSHATGNQIDRNISPRNVWLRAYDRAEMFICAKRASEFGLNVAGYSMGAIRVMTNREGLPKVMDFAGLHVMPCPNYHVLGGNVGYSINDNAWMDEHE